MLSGALLLGGLLLIQTQLLQRLDLLLYDQYLVLWSRAPDPSIEIVTIDQRSLDALGRWPWPRRIHAAMIDRLSAAGARVIGLDLLFVEPDPQDPEGDRVLADAIARSGRVVLPVYPRRAEDGRIVEGSPLAQLRRAAAALGHVDVELDIDGVVRSVFLKGGVGAPTWPVLPLAMLQLDGLMTSGPLPGARREPPYDEALDGLWVRDYQLLMPFAGPPGHFPKRSFIDLLRAPPGSLDLRGKWVLVGVDAAGLGDALATPVSRDHRLMSGIEFNANTLDALLSNITPEPLDARWSAIAALLLGGLALLLYPLLTTGWSLLLWSSLLLAVPLTSGILLYGMQLWFPPAAALVLLLGGYPLWLWGRLERVEQSSSMARERTLATFAALSGGVIAVDREWRIDYLNPTAESLIGLSLEHARGKPIKQLLRTVSGDWPNGRTDDSGSLELVTNDGEVYWAGYRSITDRLGQHHGWMLSLRDGQDAAADGGQGVALYQDALTGLPSRALLVAQLQQTFLRADRLGHQVALLFVNLDGFRRINRERGYRNGDRLLKRVAVRMRGCLRESDLLARNGSDEFVVVLEDLFSGHMVAQIARKLIEQIAIPYRIDGQVVEVTARIGISLYPKDGRDPETLLKNAYSLLRDKSLCGPGSFRYYSHQLHEQVKLRHDIEVRLGYALERNELMLVYQPQLDLATGRVTGAEALLRWRDADGYEILPEQFVPVAEESGLIHRIGSWVLESACRQLRLWLDQGLEVRYLSVNLSPVQLQSDALMPRLERLLEREGLRPDMIELELTEGAIMHDLERCTSLLGAYRDSGGRIAVDDFGTGYSTFSYLKRLPLDRLKIDKEFIRDIATFEDDAIIACSIISMAHGLNLEVIAEGVENEAQLQLLREHGCDLVQGYLVSRPLLAEQFVDWLRESATPRSVYTGNAKF